MGVQGLCALQCGVGFGEAFGDLDFLRAFRGAGTAVGAGVGWHVFVLGILEPSGVLVAGIVPQTVGAGLVVEIKGTGDVDALWAGLAVAACGAIEVGHAAQPDDVIVDGGDIGGGQVCLIGEDTDVLFDLLHGAHSG